MRVEGTGPLYGCLRLSTLAGATLQVGCTRQAWRFTSRNEVTQHAIDHGEPLRWLPVMRRIAMDSRMAGWNSSAATRRRKAHQLANPSSPKTHAQRLTSEAMPIAQLFSTRIIPPCPSHIVRNQFSRLLPPTAIERLRRSSDRSLGYGPRWILHTLLDRSIRGISTLIF